jgi:hypothetical protein
MAQTPKEIIFVDAIGRAGDYGTPLEIQQRRHDAGLPGFQQLSAAPCAFVNQRQMVTPAPASPLVGQGPNVYFSAALKGDDAFRSVRGNGHWRENASDGVECRGRQLVARGEEAARFPRHRSVDRERYQHRGFTPASPAAQCNKPMPLRQRHRAELRRMQRAIGQGHQTTRRWRSIEHPWFSEVIDAPEHEPSGPSPPAKLLGTLTEDFRAFLEASAPRCNGQAPAIEGAGEGCTPSGGKIDSMKFSKAARVVAQALSNEPISAPQLGGHAHWGWVEASRLASN